MKKSILIVSAVILTLLVASMLSAYADRFEFRGGVWVGPGPYWGYPYPYYNPYYAAPPVVIQEQPPVYVQPAPQQEEQSYWYFCPNPKGYYPYVKQCPGGWLKVVPEPPSEQQGR